MPGRSIPEEQDAHFRMYQFMVPPSLIHDRSIGFMGMEMGLSASITAYLQALWLTAYFEGEISLPATDEEVQWKAVLYNRFGKWRYPAGFGAKYPDFAFDTVPYFDVLLRDLELERWKKKDWLREIIEPYGPDDYIGVVEEWIEQKRGKRVKEEVKKDL